ncbi:MAG: XrtA/PEP-CTERM system histidine kinase PrsK [Desulfatitalea sp.]
MAVAIYALDLILLFSCVLDARPIAAERRLSFMLLRLIAFVPLLAGQYAYFYFQPTAQPIPTLFLSENFFALLLLLLAYRLQQLLKPDGPLFVLKRYRWLPWAVAAVVAAVGAIWLFAEPAHETVAGGLILPYFGQLYFSALFVLLGALILAWRLESFWRQLGPRERRQYRHLIIGAFVLIGSLTWSASYRMAYLRLADEHLLLLAILFGIAWLLIVDSVARHRLLNRKIFISRKVVYSAIAPVLFSIYLIVLGGISLLIRTFGWSLPFVLQWLLIVLGLLLIVTLAFSSIVRGHIKYFVSTHFYVNKYEYRDEWLAFSELLQGKLSEKDVVDALRRILLESLYTRTITIWLGDTLTGFRCMADPAGPTPTLDLTLAADDALVGYLQSARYLNVAAAGEDPRAQRIVDQKTAFLQAGGWVLVSAMTIGGQCVGLIGLGPEYTSGKYGRDDFDLLAALGSQAASALLAARTAERLAHARELSAWDTLAAFVLHDIKNAATMLGLVRQNAPEHIHDPEFQQDMLASIDDALKRMTKVQTRLKTLKGEIVAVLGPLELRGFLDEAIQKLTRKLPHLHIVLHCPQPLTIQTDPEFLHHILENLLLNAFEAGSGVTAVRIEVAPLAPDSIQIQLTDDGPGIPAEMLPDRLFEPFATTKEKGSGIGLWQVRRLAQSLNGTIEAGNAKEGGGCFQVRLPLNAPPP